MNIDNRMAFQKLDAYGIAKEIAERVHRAKIGDNELRDQATRASKSCFLQLSEGLPSESAAMRRKYFASATGSLCETVAAVDLAEGIGAIESNAAREILALAPRLKQMLRAMTR